MKVKLMISFFFCLLLNLGQAQTKKLPATRLQLNGVCPIVIGELIMADGTRTRSSKPATIDIGQVEMDGKDYVKIDFEDEEYSHELFLTLVSVENLEHYLEHYTYPGEEEELRKVTMTYYKTKMSAEGKEVDFSIQIEGYWGKQTYNLFLNTSVSEKESREAEGGVVEKNNVVEQAFWQQAREVFTELATLNEVSFKKLKGDKAPEKRNAFYHDINKYAYQSAKTFDLYLFDQEQCFYVYRKGHSESMRIYIEKVSERTNLSEKSFYAYRKKMIDVMNEVLGEDYTLLLGDEMKRESVYYNNKEGINHLWKHQAEMGERELKKKFVWMGYDRKNDKLEICFHNIFPEK